MLKALACFWPLEQSWLEEVTSETLRSPDHPQLGLGDGEGYAPSIAASLSLFSFVAKNKHPLPSLVTTQPAVGWWRGGCCRHYGNGRQRVSAGGIWTETCSLWFPHSLTGI